MSFILIEIFCYGSIQTLFLKLTPWAPPEFVRIQTACGREKARRPALEAVMRCVARNKTKQPRQNLDTAVRNFRFGTRRWLEAASR